MFGFGLLCQCYKVFPGFKFLLTRGRHGRVSGVGGFFFDVLFLAFGPMVQSLSQLSVFADAGVASAASLCLWFFSGTWLKVVVVGALLPSIIVATLIAIALVGIAFRPAYSLFSTII